MIKTRSIILVIIVCTAQCLAVTLLLVGMSASAEIRLPHLLSDHAVLQREAPIHLWGWASPGAQLRLTFHDQVVSSIVDSMGEWNVWFKPEAAGGPYELLVAGDGERRINDIMVGDVWFAAGQSNMQFPLKGLPNAPMKDSAKEIASAQNPAIRLIVVGRKGSNSPLNDITGSWTDSTPQTAADFSAIGYLFAQGVAAREHVTVGIVDASWGGTPAGSWISMDTLGNDASLLPVFSAQADLLAGPIHRGEQLDALSRASQDKNAAPAQHGWRPEVVSWTPTSIYNGMIAPCTGYSLKGFIWYQGESDTELDRAAYYSRLFPALIADWRSHFAQGDLPFLFVQISSFKGLGRYWGIVRDSQRRTLFIRNTAMVVSTDVGEANQIHPSDKRTVAERLVLVARAMVYGEKVSYASPLFRESTVEKDGVRVWFDNNQGLTARAKLIQGFDVSGEDHRWIPASARIEDGTIIVSSPEIKSPRYVRYAWSNIAPTDPVMNAAGFPMSTFTSEPVATP